METTGPMEPDKLKSFAKAFRQEVEKVAASAKGDGPSFRNLCGWRFGLSFGAQRPTEQDVSSMSDEQTIEFVKRVQKKTLKLEEVAAFRESVLSLPQESTGGLEDHQWIFSASLHPRGRLSTDADWSFLGQVTAALGIPENSLITPMETTHPNAVHYWIWYEVPVVKPGTSVFS